MVNFYVVGGPVVISNMLGVFGWRVPSGKFAVVEDGEKGPQQAINRLFKTKEEAETAAALAAEERRRAMERKKMFPVFVSASLEHWSVWERLATSPGLQDLVDGKSTKELQTVANSLGDFGKNPKALDILADTLLANKSFLFTMANKATRRQMCRFGTWVPEVVKKVSDELADKS